jgi:hypothetical protein
MATFARRVALSTTEARLDQAGTDNVTGRSVVAMHPGVTVYLGPSGVTSANGVAWTAGTLSADLDPGDQLYAILGSGTATCHVLLTGA